MAGKCCKCKKKGLVSFEETAIVMTDRGPAKVTFFLYRCNKCGEVMKWKDTI